MKHKILIVDDEPANLEAMAHIFEQAGENFEVLQSTDGLMAYRVLEMQRPHLVITDWKMPNCNGIHLLKKIRQNPDFEHIPVIVFSGVMTCPDCVAEALDEGATDFIHKPIEPIELIARSKSMLKLADSYQQIKELNASKDLLFNMVAHDLKNSVGGLRNLLELVSNPEYRENCDKRLDLIKRASAQAQKSYNLLDNLLTWARTQLKNFEPTPQPVNLQTAMGEVCDEFENEITLHQLNVQVECAPGLKSRVDKNMLHLMLRNVLSNSIKFTHQTGNIHLKAFADDEKQQNLVQVTDNGCGISKENLRSIVNENKLIQQYGVRGENGNGIGLKLIRELTRLNNGELHIHSEEGVGTTVTIHLPRV